MEMNNIIKTAIGVVVVSIIIISVAIPILAGINLSQTTIIEIDGHRYAEMSPDDDVVLSVNNDVPNVTINGSKQDAYIVENSPSNQKPLSNIIGENIVISYDTGDFICYYYNEEGGIERYIGDSATITHDSINGDPIKPGKIWIIQDEGEYINIADPSSSVSIPLSNAAIFCGYAESAKIVANLNGSEVVNSSYLSFGVPVGLEVDIVISGDTITYPNFTTIDSHQYQVFVILAPYEVSQASATDRAIDNIIAVIPIIMIAGIMIAVIGTFLHMRE